MTTKANGSGIIYMFICLPGLEVTKLRKLMVLREGQKLLFI